MRISYKPYGEINITDVDLESIRRASRRFAEGDYKLSTHEYTAAAIICGQPEEIKDIRRAFIEMGRDWAHGVVEVIFSHWELEMTLSPSDPNCPVGDQRIYTRD